MTISEARSLSTRHVLRRSLLVALALGVMVSFGCANGEIRLGDPFDREFSLEEAQHRYSVLIRWSRFQQAKEFVAPENRPAFLQSMKALKHARFIDFESEALELDNEKQTATIEVVYTLYTPSVPYEVELTETQNWSRDDYSNNWTVDSKFDSLNDIASN